MDYDRESSYCTTSGKGLEALGSCPIRGTGYGATFPTKLKHQEELERVCVLTIFGHLEIWRLGFSITVI